MFNRHFQQELTNLKELGAEFAKAHPAVAPMLSGPTSDPDVERLLEGVAFLTAQIREKLDDEFPEIIHELIQLIWPHYLRPIPSCAIVAFSPKPALKQKMIIPADVQLASVPVEGTTCKFKTCYDVEIHPIELVDAAYVESPGKAPVIRIGIELKGLTLNNWSPGILRFHLAGNYSDAADKYFLFRQHVRRVIVRTSENKRSLTLGPDHIKSVGFSPSQGVIPYPSHAFPAYRFLQEYFYFPQKFLFFDLSGLDRWSDRGDGNRFELDFELDSSSTSPPRIKKEDFSLFATPVINLFPYAADPIRLDHRQTEYLVRPAGTNSTHYQVYTIEDVVGHIQGTAKARVYKHFNFFKSDAASHPVYQTSLKKSPIRSGADVYLQVAYPSNIGPPVAETLSLNLICTNGILPESNQVGDISQGTSNSPEYAKFSNIGPPTLSAFPPLGTNLLWRLLSHLNLNHVSLANADNLKALLGIYLFPESRDRTGRLANQKRIDGINEVSSKAADRLVSGLLMRGREITTLAHRDHFAGDGDLYLFGCVLNEFIGLYSSINTFTRFTLKDILRGKVYQWPARLGDHPLI